MGAGAALAIGGVPAAQGAGEPRSTIATESNTAQTSRSGCGYNFFMNPDAIRILTVERDGDDGVIVTFSDGTTRRICGRGTARTEAEARTYRNAEDSDSNWPLP
jgi:hypothetical protein